MDQALLTNAICVITAVVFGLLYVRKTFSFMEEMDIAPESKLPLMIRLLTWLFMCGIAALILGAAGLYRDGIQLGFFGFMFGILAGHAPFMLGVLSDMEEDDVLELLPEWIVASE